MFPIKTAASVVAFSAMASSAQGVVTYTMTQGGFSPTWVQFTQHGVGTGGSGISFGQSSGGNPGEYRIFETNVNAAGSAGDYAAYATSLLFANPYDPMTQGAIGDLTYREDFRTTQSVQFSGPVVRQGGNFYFAPVLTVSAANWTSSNVLTLDASDFWLFTGSTTQWLGLDSSQNPDFSATGGVMDFGVFRGVGDIMPGGSADSAIGHIDNIQIVIPGPGVAGALMAIGAIGMRRGRRASAT